MYLSCLKQHSTLGESELSWANRVYFYGFKMCEPHVLLVFFVYSNYVEVRSAKLILHVVRWDLSSVLNIFKIFYTDLIKFF